MLNVSTGRVARVLERRRGIEKLLVAPDDGETPQLSPEPEGAVLRWAINYPDLGGPVEAGDRVLLNTTAVDLALGTGGWDFVVANLSRLEGRAAQRFGEGTAGHLMKLRYAPHQVALHAAEEAHPDLPEGLAGRPVLIAELHSQLAPALIGLRLAVGAGEHRIAYVMPDAAALPLALSDTVPLLQARGLIHATVTCGHAFGGDLEAVSLGSGLLIAAGPAQGDVLVVVQGPGNAGTGSVLGFGGLYCAEAAHLAAALGGDPILVARASDADPRPRHRGLSHHTRTLLERLLLVPVTVGLPDAGADELRPSGETGHNRAPLPRPRHRVEWAPADALRAALGETDLPLQSMGRGLEDDPIFFLAAAAGGWVAGRRLLRRAGAAGEP